MNMIETQKRNRNKMNPDTIKWKSYLVLMKWKSNFGLWSMEYRNFGNSKLVDYGIFLFDDILTRFHVSLTLFQTK